MKPVDAKNLVLMFEAQAAQQGDKTVMTFKRDGRWQEISWKEAARRARDVSDGLAAVGVKPGDRVALIGDTSAEWIICDLGIMGAGAITVPIYQSNPAHEVQYILDDCRAVWVLLDHEHQAEKIRSQADRLPALKGVVRFHGAPQADHERTLHALEQAGQEWRKANPAAHDARMAGVGPEDAASILYTSGTTGNPKGVVLTHGNWTYEARGAEEMKILNHEDLVLMFLPMAHSFAKVIEAAWLVVGCTVAFVESIEKLVDNAQEIRPTVMPSVPRIFEKAYNAVLTKGLATPGLKGWLFGITMNGFDAWAEGQEKGIEVRTVGFRMGEKLVFPKLAASLKERFGGRMRLFVSGGAPLPSKVQRFFLLCGFTLLEGWGLTETSAGTCVNRIGANKVGTVGPPFPGTEIKIAEDGEILVKGGGVMKGYYNRPDATAEVLKDGWLLTGDIGEVDADGYVKITDRKKDLIKTSGGKYVAPQNLENELKMDPLISQVLVHGDQRKFVSALVTLNLEAARAWATEHGISEEASLHDEPRMIARIQHAVDALNARQAGYATIKRFAILAEDFTQEAGTLTPTLKVKRKVVAQRQKALLDSFYAE